MSDQLSNAQRAVITHAATETDGKVVWFPEQIRGGAQGKILQSLFDKGLIIQERENWSLTERCYALLDHPRTVSLPPEIPEIPVFIKAASSEPPEKSGPATEVKPVKQTKQQIMIDLLNTPNGASIPELMAATGWQQHTVRGALSGTLKKRLGLRIESVKTDGADRTYRIVETSGDAL